MPYYLRPFFLIACLFIGSSLLADCQSQARRDESTEQTSPQTSSPAQARKKHSRHHRNRSTDSYRDNTAQSQTKAGSVPQKVYDVLAYVNANGRPMAGYVGGRRFGNFENHLPRSDTDGRPINYQEWDVNPKVSGRNRGTERLVTGSDGRAWYTNDHYNTFVEVHPN